MHCTADAFCFLLCFVFALLLARRLSGFTQKSLRFHKTTVSRQCHQIAITITIVLEAYRTEDRIATAILASE